MSFEAVIIIGIIIAGFFFLYMVLKRNQPSDDMLEIVKLLQSTAQKDRETLLSTLQQHTHSLNARLDRAAEVIGHVQRNIGEMSEIGRGMKEMQEFLRSPKLRGTMGEHILKELLTQLLPKQSFHLQYKFRNGVTVDAAIQTANGIIPIDSKFPLENFRHMTAAETESEKSRFSKLFTADVRKHIKDISEKYILTQEGTIDYALMYIPSEAVYYEIVNSISLYEYAGESRVLPVSPTTFYAFLKAILMSYEGQKIEKQAREILRTFRALQSDYQKLEGSLGTLARHITNAYNATASVMTHFSTLGHRLTNSLPHKQEENDQLKIEE
ncbi:DNA recombination protein RmuC [Candidatus Roizmanbacteria bacterium]|nr:DNA recombination protein RmuC [Candidatus Roizmanbacteria bacterium]